MYLIIPLSLLIFVIIFLRVKIPFIPFDNLNKIQSFNQQEVQLSLSLIVIPFIVYHSYGILSLLYLSLFLIGYFDDKYSLSVKVRFLITTILLFFLVIFSNQIIQFSFLSDLPIFFSLTITLIFLLGFIHTINMIDGRNGFVLIVFINCLILLNYKIFLSPSPSYDILILNIILCLMFVINMLNISYLGNSGSILLTIFIGIIIINSYNQQLISEKEIFCIFSIPFYDGLRVSLKRFLNQKNLFLPDNNHLHHIPKNWNYGIFVISFFLLIHNLLAINFQFHIAIFILITLIFYFLLFFTLKRF